MKKKISIIVLLGILIIAVLGLASAVTVYSGESYSFESEEFEYYTVIGNSSNMEGMDIIWDNGNTIISFVSNFKPDSFTLLFFNQEEEVITEYVSSGGGTTYVDKEVIVEVPNYIREEVEVIKEVPIYLDREVEVIEEVSIGLQILIVFGIVLFLFLIVSLIKGTIFLIKRRKNGRQKEINN